MKKLLIALSAIPMCTVSAFAEDPSYGPGDDVVLDAAATYGAVSMTGGTLTINGGATLTAASLTCAAEAGVTAKIVVNEGGALCVDDISNTTEGGLRIEQNGGALRFKHMHSSGKGCITTEGTNGHDIDIDIPEDGDTCLFDVADADSLIVFTGECNFVKRGTSTQQQPSVNYEFCRALRFTYTGTTTINGSGVSGGWSYNGAGFPAGTDMILTDNACVRTGGGELSVGSLNGNGHLYDWQPGRVRLTSDTKDSNLSMIASALISVVNDGQATVTISPDQMPIVTANKGRVNIRSRAEVGYRCYRLTVTDVRGYKEYEPYMQFCGLYLMNGDVDTVDNIYSPSPKAAHGNGAPNCVFDRVNVAEKWFAFPGAQMEIIFDVNQPLTTYTMMSGDDSPNRDPRSFTLEGCDDSYNWRLLSSVVDCTGQFARMQMYEDAPFPVTNWPSAMHLDTLTIGADAIVTVSGDIAFDAGAVDCNGTFALSDGAVFRVSNGESKLVTHGKCTNRFWRFEFPLCNDGPQFGELGLFDNNGDRLNLTEDITGLTGNMDFTKIFDGDFMTQCWIGTGGAYWLEFELKEVPEAGVASFDFARDMSQPGMAYKTPTYWKVYTKAAADDEWTLAYEGGTTGLYDVDGFGLFVGSPFKITSKEIQSAPPAAFAAETPVAVAAGATLDLSETSTVLGDLRVDCNDAGTIKGGALAESGVLRLDNYVPGAEVPLRLDGTEVPADLSGWSIVANGKARSNWTMEVSSDGKILVLRSGMVFIIR